MTNTNTIQLIFNMLKLPNYKAVFINTKLDKYSCNFPSATMHLEHRCVRLVTDTEMTDLSTCV